MFVSISSFYVQLQWYLYKLNDKQLVIFFDNDFDRLFINFSVIIELESLPLKNTVSVHVSVHFINFWYSYSTPNWKCVSYTICSYNIQSRYWIIIGGFVCDGKIIIIGFVMFFLCFFFGFEFILRLFVSCCPFSSLINSKARSDRALYLDFTLHIYIYSLQCFVFFWLSAPGFYWFVVFSLVRKMIIILRIRLSFCFLYNYMFVLTSNLRTARRPFMRVCVMVVVLINQRYSIELCKRFTYAVLWLLLCQNCS